MTLNEKLYKKTGIYIMADNCEKIANEFAIGFAEWILDVYIEHNDIITSTDELLEIYKKENGL
jgi:hypothetical protein